MEWYNSQAARNRRIVRRSEGTEPDRRLWRIKGGRRFSERETSANEVKRESAVKSGATVTELTERRRIIRLFLAAALNCSFDSSLLSAGEVDAYFSFLTTLHLADILCVILNSYNSSYPIPRRQSSQL